MKLRILSREKSPGTFELSLDGRLDAQSYLQLEDTVDRILACKPRAIQFNMEKLDYISSIGLGVVLQTVKRLKAIGGRCVLTNLQPHIRKVFDIAKVLPRESVFAGVEEADRYLDAMQRRARRGRSKSVHQS